MNTNATDTPVSLRCHICRKLITVQYASYSRYCRYCNKTVITCSLCFNLENVSCEETP